MCCAAADSTLRVSYTDPADGTDVAVAIATIDPVQRVFESRSGTVVDGAEIELVDAVIGPARDSVFGNDGVSQFPSTIISGSSATDSSGTLYVFGLGEYRFPVVPDGDYVLIVRPPSDYVAPSTVSVDDLQALPGAPYALGPASFGTAFTKSGELSIALDIPVDPRSDRVLFLQKRTTTTTAAPGDFVRYEPTLKNASAIGVANDVEDVIGCPPAFASCRVRPRSTAFPCRTR